MLRASMSSLLSLPEAYSACLGGGMVDGTMTQWHMCNEDVNIIPEIDNMSRNKEM